jgi:type II secretory pathway predicted ATPase ExeA
VLAGRDEVLDAGDEAITVAVLDRRTPMPVMLVGPRGVGKTVVLDEISRRAGERYGWPRLWVEASRSTPLDSLLAREADLVYRVVADEATTTQRLKLSEAVLRAQVLGVGGEVRLARDAPAPSLKSSLGGLIDRLAQADSGLVVVVDEAQAAATDDFALFASTVQRAVGDSLPLITLVAGLPTLRRRTSDTEASLGYLERADWHELGALSAEETREALEATASQAGRPMDPEASVVLGDASGGYPYAVQVYGKHAWRVSDNAPRIQIGHANQALPPASRELERNLYEARWAQTPASERAYLRAVANLASDGAPVTGRAVADRLGVTTRAVSPARSRLISRGTLIAEGEELSFMVPGMGAWIRRQQPVDPRPARTARTLQQRDIPKTSGSER